MLALGYVRFAASRQWPEFRTTLTPLHSTDTTGGAFLPLIYLKNSNAWRLVFAMVVGVLRMLQMVRSSCCPSSEGKMIDLGVGVVVLFLRSGTDLTRGKNRSLA